MGRTSLAADMEQVRQVNAKIDELVKKNPDIKTLPPELYFVAVINQTMAKTFWPDQDAVEGSSTGRNAGDPCCWRGGGQQRLRYSEEAFS